MRLFDFEPSVEGTATAAADRASSGSASRNGKALTAVDLFSGCGGLSAGLLASGINVVEAYDFWPRALETYSHNLGGHAFRFDLSDTASAVERIADIGPDLIAGSPPCQDFSTAGKRVESDRANLTIAYAEIVSGCRPAVFLMENVPQVRNSAVYRDMRHLLQAEGYNLAELVLDASYFGVPQLRRRFFAIGFRDHNDACIRFLEAVSARRTPERLTVKQYLDGEIDVDFYYRHPRNYNRRSVFSVHEPSPTVRGVNRPVPPNYAGNHLDSVPPSEVRPLTTLERSRVQTFPADWEWACGDRNADAELQIGNAVPVQLAARLGEAILDAVRH